MKNLSGNESVDEDTTSKEYAGAPSKRKRFALLLTQRWPEYIVEIIVVIIGITISFAISNYQQDSNDRRVAQIYLQDLREDIKSDIAALRATINQTERVILSGHALINQSSPEINITKKGFVDLVRTIIERPNFISKNATFSSLKTSATFQLIKDIELRKLLFEYDQDYQTIKGRELAELQATVTIVAPYIMKSIPLTDSPRSLSRLERLDVDAILGSVEFTNSVDLRIGNREELLKSYREILETALQIEKGIQRNLQ